jgi:hypothetical protein
MPTKPKLASNFALVTPRNSLVFTSAVSFSQTSDYFWTNSLRGGANGFSHEERRTYVHDFLQQCYWVEATEHISSCWNETNSRPEQRTFGSNISTRPFCFIHQIFRFARHTLLSPCCTPVGNGERSYLSCLLFLVSLALYYT